MSGEFLLGYRYRIGILKKYAQNYDQYQQVAYSGVNNWEGIIETLADLERAAVKTGNKGKLDRMRWDATFQMTNWDYRAMLQFLNGGK